MPGRLTSGKASVCCRLYTEGARYEWLGARALDLSTAMGSEPPSVPVLHVRPAGLWALVHSRRSTGRAGAISQLAQCTTMPQWGTSWVQAGQHRAPLGNTVTARQSGSLQYRWQCQQWQCRHSSVSALHLHSRCLSAPMSGLTFCLQRNHRTSLQRLACTRLPAGRSGGSPSADGNRIKRRLEGTDAGKHAACTLKVGTL